MQGLNITGAAAPGVTTVGGLVTMKSVHQLLQEEKEKALSANSAPVVQGLAGHIRLCWSAARRSKETTIEQRMLQCMRQRRGEYDPDKLALIKQQGGSEIYMMLTSNKCRAASSWLRDVMLTGAEEQPWTIAPTSSPDIDPQTQQELLQQATMQVAQMHDQGMNPSVLEVRQMLVNMRDQVMAAKVEFARAACDRMERKMRDQLEEGGWTDALSDFIDDLTTFPSAFLKGPVVRRRPKLKWMPGPNGSYTPQLQDDLSLEWERVSPFNIYPAPDSSGIDDTWLIERHRLHRQDLNAMLNVEGYSDKAIRAVLDEHGRGGLHEWINIDIARAEVEGKAPTVLRSNPSELIDALQFWGSVQGKMLIEWGIDEKQVEDPLREYNIEAWLIGNWVIKAVVNPDPLGRKPYFKASYEEIPGSFWGNSVADLCRDTQDVCNAAARALVNNMGIASGPQVMVNVDRMPEGETITQMYPWKIWQATNDPMGGSAPPMDFFQPNSMSQELMSVYDKFAVLADEYTGIPRYMTGDSPTGGAGRTASGMSMLMSNAGKSIKQVIANIDVSVVAPAISRLYFYNMMYSADPDLKGDVNVVARGAASLVVKEQAQQRRNEFLNIALNSPIVAQVIGMEGIATLLRENAKTLDLNTDNIVPPIEILKQRWAQQQAAQAAMMQQQPQLAGPQQPQQASPDSGGAQLMDGATVTNDFQPNKSY